jgi:hypothetical protein
MAEQKALVFIDRVLFDEMGERYIEGRVMMYGSMRVFVYEPALHGDGLFVFLRGSIIEVESGVAREIILVCLKTLAGRFRPPNVTKVVW